MHGSMGRNLVMGFIAAAIAVVTVHQAIVYGLTAAGWIKGTPWSFTATIAPFAVPYIANTIFWGGLWGALYGVTHHLLPGGAAWLKGLIFGLLISVCSNWLAIPFIKGTLLGQKGQVFFAGFDPQRMLATVLIVGGFGIATALVYRMIGERD